MADIELVIKIPEEMYHKTVAGIYEGEESDCLIIDTFTYAIENGTPLPKGHGRLFDEIDIVNGNYEIIGNKIYELEPIIKADKEGGAE